jgi:hypothetical protein
MNMPIYVQHEVLGRIADVFNAEAIWQAPGLALFARRPLLRDLLERSPREHRGRAATRCFSHVTLVLPQEDVDDDYHLTRGARARDLAQTLTSLHQKDFGDLLGSDQVRYDVVGAESLAPGEIEVRFGHAVYLPAPDEKILYNVSVSRDSAIWHPVCPIYPNQRLALIGDPKGQAGASATGWPFGPDGAILVINDGPDSVPVVEMRPRGDFDCRFDPRSGYYTIKSLRDTAGSSPRLLLKIARSSAAPRAAPRPAAMPDSHSAVSDHAGAPAIAPAPTPASAPVRPAVWQSRSDGMPLDATATPAISASTQPPAVPANLPGESDATYAPLAQQRVHLVALALPRLSRYRETGAQALELPFDQALALSADATATPAISFVLDAADNLYACTPEGRQRVTAPATFTPVDTRTMRLLPAAPAMADRYHALLCLAQPVGAAVASGARFTFGRSSPMLAALRVLDSPRFIRRADGGLAGGASADRIGLSRNAFSFEASDSGYKIGRLTASQALFHLDERMAFVAMIGGADGDAPYLLPHGHHLVAGHYVLRFDA